MQVVCDDAVIVLDEIERLLHLFVHLVHPSTCACTCSCFGRPAPSRAPPWGRGSSVDACASICVAVSCETSHMSALVSSPETSTHLTSAGASPMMSRNGVHCAYASGIVVWPYDDLSICREFEPACAAHQLLFAYAAWPCDSDVAFEPAGGLGA